MENPTILVLMSTYNGQKYIKEQLDSILQQENVDVEILIRDDGSTDNTIDLLLNYSEKYHQIEYYIGNNVGPAQSFKKLINDCDSQYEYYAYADQDDIWDKKKLCTAISDMRGDMGLNPVLWYCGFSKLIGDKISGQSCCSVERASTLETACYTCATTNGCTMVFNRELLNILRMINPGEIDMHDSWTNIVCIACGGKIICNPLPLVTYRIHKGQALGYINKSVKKKMKRLIKPSKERHKQIQNILSCPEILTVNKKFLEQLAFYKENYKCKWNILLSRKPKGMTIKEIFKFKLQIMLNIY